jgi:hypothetical protein
MVSGRKPGYKHNKETKEKISQTRQGQLPAESTKEKMRQAKLGHTCSEEERKAMATQRAHKDLENKCMGRFKAMRSEYPGHEDFFDTNQEELLVAMRDLKSEKELRDIRRYFETTHIDEAPQAFLQYQYESSSVFAHEEIMVDLIDAAAFLRSELRTKGQNVLLH